jgi:hypothetical protein
VGIRELTLPRARRTRALLLPHRYELPRPLGPRLPPSLSSFGGSERQSSEAAEQQRRIAGTTIGNMTAREMPYLRARTVKPPRHELHSPGLSRPRCRPFLFRPSRIDNSLPARMRGDYPATRPTFVAPFRDRNSWAPYVLPQRFLIAGCISRSGAWPCAKISEFMSPFLPFRFSLVLQLYFAPLTCPIRDVSEVAAGSSDRGSRPTP